jgi:dCTP deaminase
MESIMVGGILSDRTLKMALEEGTIKIDPFTAEHLNAASYDVTLGDEVVVYKKWVEYDKDYEGSWSLGAMRMMATGKPRDGSDFQVTGRFTNPILDVREEPETASFKMTQDYGWILKPGIGYLMHTRERVHTKDFVPVLDGKSSIGRLFLTIHVTAGYGDPGFDGQFTLEVKATHPIRVFPGMKIGQIRFHTVVGEIDKLYSKVGHYTGKAAEGAVPSQAWRQFQKA